MTPVPTDQLTSRKKRHAPLAARARRRAWLAVVASLLLPTASGAVLLLQGYPKFPQKDGLKNGMIWRSTIQELPDGRYNFEYWTREKDWKQHPTVGTLEVRLSERTQLRFGRWICPMAVRFSGKSALTTLEGATIDETRFRAAREFLAEHLRIEEDYGYLRVHDAVRAGMFSETSLFWPGIAFNVVRTACVLSIPLSMLLLARGVWSLTRGRAARLRKGHCPRCDFNLLGAFDSGCTDCGWNRA